MKIRDSTMKLKEQSVVVASFLLAILAIYLIFVGKVASETSPNLTCSMRNSDNYCEFIRHKCDLDYFNIAEKYYCSRFYPSNYLWLFSAVFLVLVLILLLSILSVIVSNFLYVGLENIIELFNINKHVLSFVIIPLVNALPDLVNYHYTIKAKSIELVLGQLIGSSLIMCTVIIGIISFLRPFSISRNKDVMIDFILLLVVLLMLFVILSDGKITKTECAIMVIGYVIYVTYLFWNGKELEKEMLDSILNPEETLEILSGEEDEYGSVESGSTESDVEDFIKVESLTISKLYFHTLEKTLSFLIPITSIKEPSKSILRQNLWFQLWFFVEVPIMVNMRVLKLEWADLIPIILTLIIISHVIPFGDKFKSLVISVIQVAISLLIISDISVQTLKILKNYGTIFRLSDYILGLFVFSISNSANDIITNVTIATKINPLYGINSCLGTPVLLVLIGIGFHGLYISITENYVIEFQLVGSLVFSTLSLMIAVAVYLIYVPLNNWMFDRKLGVGVSISYFLISLGNLL